MSAPRTVLITGASGAIGGALAEAYAGPGTRLLLHGRRTEALAPLAERCRALGAEVECHSVPLSDDDALTVWLEELVHRCLPDIVILNAGQNCHVAGPGELEPWAEVSDMLTINLRVPLAMANFLAPRMARRGSGRLVLIGSLAAWYGLPTTPAYSATKPASRPSARGYAATWPPTASASAWCCQATSARPCARPCRGPSPGSGPRRRRPESSSAAWRRTGLVSASPFRSTSAAGGWRCCRLASPSACCA